MQSKKIEVRCECGEKKTIGSLMTKIVAGAEQLQHTLDSSQFDFLSHSFFHTKQCAKCEGRSFINIANGPDDFDKETCGACKGTGRVVAGN